VSTQNICKKGHSCSCGCSVSSCFISPQVHVGSVSTCSFCALAVWSLAVEGKYTIESEEAEESY
jgi:hypothetical protein